MDERDALQPASTEEEARIGETCLFMNERGRLRVNPWCPERPLFEPLLFVLQLRGRPLQDKSGDRCSHCPDAMSVELLSKVVYGFVMRRRDPGVFHSRI